MLDFYHGRTHSASAMIGTLDFSASCSKYRVYSSTLNVSSYGSCEAAGGHMLIVGIDGDGKHRRDKR